MPSVFERFHQQTTASSAAKQRQSSSSQRTVPSPSSQQQQQQQQPSTKLRAASVSNKQQNSDRGFSGKKSGSNTKLLCSSKYDPKNEFEEISSSSLGLTD
mmetsp:Transcript_30088/g.45603  ORF Transcript_30088/g.45603 Transcript_30088/m.45603 type:complete len:100 (+) Transcript_30088:81-380(+)